MSKKLTVGNMEITVGNKEMPENAGRTRYAPVYEILDSLDAGDERSLDFPDRESAKKCAISLRNNVKRTSRFAGKAFLISQHDATVYLKRTE